MPNFELENYVQGQGGEKRDERQATGNVRFHNPYKWILLEL